MSKKLPFKNTLIVLFIIVVLASGVWYVIEFRGLFGIKKSSSSASCGATFFDTHTHLDDSNVPAKLAQRMKENNVSCSVIFIQINPDSYEEDLSLFYDDLGEAPGVYIPFLDVVRNRSTQITKEYLEKVYNEFGGKFAGFGEFALYRDELAGTDLTGEPWTTIYEFASEKDLFVMIHIGLNPSELAGLEAAMAAHPNTKFLVHGFELGGGGYVRLLKKYSNFYFTLDTATLLKDVTPGSGRHLMYPPRESGALEFLTEYEQNKQRQLEQAREEWTQIVLVAPDRVMWGTDVSFDWHTDSAVYKKLIEFSKEFIGGLPSEVQDKFAYQNAVTLLGDKAFVYESSD